MTGAVFLNTLEIFSQQPLQIPMGTVWLLNDLAEYRGKQELFTKQSPQKLAKLKEHAIIESAISSNRIEGVEIDQKRVGTVVFGKGLLQDREEEEVRGYQSALSLIHSDSAELKISPATIKRLHGMIRPDSWDSGKFKKDDGEIIEKHSDGRVTIRFKPTSAAETPEAVGRLCALSSDLLRNREVPPLVIWAAQNLDFLCIHPFRDGNGRVSRVLLLLFLYQLGFEAGRYISLEKLIEQSKARYYETLRQSSQGWHERKHDPWPYINYLLYTLKELYQAFERRVGEIRTTRGDKTETVLDAIALFSAPFHVTELQRRCPGVSLDMIRKVLKDLTAEGRVECTGRGKKALWRVFGNR
jgi:Fic family protein